MLVTEPQNTAVKSISQNSNVARSEQTPKALSPRRVSCLHQVVCYISGPEDSMFAVGRVEQFAPPYSTPSPFTETFARRDKSNITRAIGHEHANV